MKIISLYYHAPIVSGLEKMIKHYQNRGYRFISIEELLSVMQTRMPLKEKLAFLSLDDGWHQNFEILPVIEKYNVPVCIFVSTQPVIDGNFWWEYVERVRDKQGVNQFKLLAYEDFYRQLDEIKKKITLPRSAMTIDEVKEISKHPLISIQAHTVNHPILTSVPEDVLEFTTVQKNIDINDDIMLLPRYSLTGQWPRDLLKVKGIWWRMKHFAQALGIKRGKTIYDK